MLYAPLPNAPSVTSSVKDTQLVSGRGSRNSQSAFSAETHTEPKVKLLHDLFGFNDPLNDLKLVFIFRYVNTALCRAHQCGLVHQHLLIWFDLVRKSDKVKLILADR